MSTEQTEQQSSHISQAKLLALVRAMIGGSRGREDDEHPLPPGPWDPVIRVALERILLFGPQPEPWRMIEWVLGYPVPWRVFSPRPEPWKVIFASFLARHPEIRDVLHPRQGLGEEVALNPQPLPPRFAFLVSLAQTVITRAELIQEIADATQREGDQHGIMYIDRFVDELCGNKFKPRWPFPGPPPPWFANELDGIDLVVMATQFEQAAKEIFSQDLRQNLAYASAKFVEAGLSKMQ